MCLFDCVFEVFVFVSVCLESMVAPTQYHKVPPEWYDLF